MKIGIFTVCMPEYEPEQCFEQVAPLGYNGLEWRVCADSGDRSNPSYWNGNRNSMTPDVLIEKAPVLRSLAEKYGMEMPALGAYLNCSDMDGAEAAFKAANACGAKNVRVNTAGYRKDRPFLEQLREVREQYGKIERLAKKYGVRAVMETHMGLVNPTISTSMQILDGLDPAYAGVIWDPGNQVVEGSERYDMAIRAAGPYLAEVHVKNCIFNPKKMAGGRVVWDTLWTSLALGRVDWPAVVAELKTNGYDGWLMIEDFSLMQTTGEKLKEDIDFLRGSCGVA